MHTFHFPPLKQSLSINLQVNNQLSFLSILLSLHTGTSQLLRILCWKWKEIRLKGGWDGTAWLKRHKRRKEPRTQRHKAPEGWLFYLFSVILAPVVNSSGDLSCSMSQEKKRKEKKKLSTSEAYAHQSIHPSSLAQMLFVPPTLSSWLLLTVCSRSAVNSFVRGLWWSTVVLFCTRRFISCCCATTFCRRRREKA